MGYIPASLGDLCSIVKGTYPTLKTEPGEYPLVVTAAYRRTASSYDMEGPAVCIPLVSSTGHGDAALHRVHYQEGKFALANLLVALRPNDPTVCDAKYLYHLLQTRKDQYFVSLMQGTANVSLKERDIASVVVSLPPIAEQRRIVARIEELAAKIAEARGLRRQAMEERELLSRSARNEVFDSLRSKIDTVRLDSVAQSRLGKMLSQDAKRGLAGVPYMRNANVQWDRLDLSSVYEMDFSEAERAEFALQRGDILVCEGGNIGMAAIWNDEIPGCCYQKALHRVRVDSSKAIPRFLLNHIFWAAEQGHFAAIKTQTTIAHLTGVMLKAYGVFVPSLDEQRRIVAYLDEVQAKVNILKRLQAETAAELDALLPSVLDRAFRGES